MERGHRERGVLPGASHSIEFVVHLLRGTPNLRTSLIASVSFTMLSTLFNLYAMRRGALLVGAEGGSVGADLRRMPRLIAGFLAAGPIALFRLIGWRIAVRSKAFTAIDGRGRLRVVRR